MQFCSEHEKKRQQNKGSLYFSVLSSVDEIGWAEYKVSLGILDEIFFSCVSIFRKKVHVCKECLVKCLKYSIYPSVWQGDGLESVD